MPKRNMLLVSNTYCAGILFTSGLPACGTRVWHSTCAPLKYRHSSQEGGKNFKYML